MSSPELPGQKIAIAALAGATLKQLYVQPRYQGKGIGSALLQNAIQVSGGSLDLWTFQRNAADRAFYEHHGFIAIESTDGSTNEECEPDVRYQLTN